MAELASSSDEHDKVHEVGNETGDDNKLPSSVAEDAVQGEIDGSADMDSQIIAGSSEAEINNSTVATIADSQIPFDPSDKDTLAEDGNGLQREGTTVDVTGSKEDDMEAEEKQMDDSHLPAALQSTESSQPTEHAAPTQDDGNGLQCEGTTVDVSGSKEDIMEVEEKLIDDISGSPSSHLPVALKSTESNQPAEHAVPAEDDGDGLQSEGTAVDVVDSKKDDMEVEEKQIDISRGSSSFLPGALESAELNQPAEHTAPTEDHGNCLQSEGTAVDVPCSKEDNMEVEDQFDGISRGPSSFSPDTLESAELNQAAEHAAPTEDDGNGPQSEGTSVDVAGSKEDNIEVEEKIDDISRGSSSHLPDVLQSTPNQRAEQECLDNSDDVNTSVVSSHAPLSGPKFTCVKELEKADETLETSDAQVADEVCLQTNDGAHNMASGSCSTLEDKNEDSSAQIADCEDLLLRKGTTVDDLDGCVEGHSGLSTHSNDEVRNLVEIVKGMNDTTAGSEVHVDPESHVSDEVSMPVAPSELKVELKNQSEPACQFGAVIVEESNVSLGIQTPALAESEEMTSGGFMHGMLFSFKVARMTVILDPSNVYLPCSARVRRTGGVYSFVFPFG